jgi:hypothetical protein
MSFLNELKEKRQDAIETVVGIDLDIEATKLTLKSEQERRAFWTKRIGEIDIAIAALEPAPIPEPDLIDEASVAREQLETDHALPPSADDVVTDLQGDTVEEMREAFENVFEAQEEPGEFISELTGDPAIEPESGLHGDPVPQTEGYAPVTNPDADAIAKAHDYYSPEKVAARNRSMFSIFRRESEDA